MNDKLLQEVAHLLRKYYDDRGAKLEQYAEKVIALVRGSNSEQLILALDKQEFDRADAAHNDHEYTVRAWMSYKQYIGDKIEETVIKNKKTIKIYEAE